MVTDESTIDKHKRLAKRIPTEIAGEGATGSVDELFAEDAVVRVSPLGTAEDWDAFQELPQRMHVAFPDLEATVDRIVTEDDHVAMQLTLSGTHRGPFMGADPTEEEFEIEHTSSAQFADDEIVELWGQLDTFGLLRQIGVTEAPME
jgi:predicted ester cyclase